MTDFVENYMHSSNASYFKLTDTGFALDYTPWNVSFVYQNNFDGLSVDIAGAADWPPSSRHNRNEDRFVTLPVEAYKYVQVLTTI